MNKNIWRSERGFTEQVSESTNLCKAKGGGFY